ncbi:11225_t:CDS:2 [Diversispora eburnea]|uniref:11225_t:CDS:1 n=1 Tax=Diversispora eburnea TaxID=1213867 RepID=A0A9N9F2W6_9GLOM|nr:11225_t:CDS:2 [Diversispora eburnea]
MGGNSPSHDGDSRRESNKNNSNRSSNNPSELKTFPNYYNSSNNKMGYYTDHSERRRENNVNSTFNNSSKSNTPTSSTITSPNYAESIEIPCYDPTIKPGPWEFQKSDCRKVNCGLMLTNIKNIPSLGISVFSDQNDSYHNW